MSCRGDLGCLHETLSIASPAISMSSATLTIHSDDDEEEDEDHVFVVKCRLSGALCSAIV